MDPWQIDHLIQRRRDLINFTRCSTNLLSLLRPKVPLNADDLDYLDTIRQKDGAREQTNKLYDALSTRTDAYRILVEMLFETNQTGAGNILLEGYRKNNRPIPFDLSKPPFNCKNDDDLILDKSVMIQGHAVKLLNIIEQCQPENITSFITQHLDDDTRTHILHNDTNYILIPDKIPVSVDRRRYISRSLYRRTKLTPQVLTANISDIFVITGISRSKLSNLVYPNITSTSREQLIRSEQNLSVRFICLEGNNDFERLCQKSNGTNVHLLECSETGINWLRTHGNIGTLQQYIDGNQDIMDGKAFYDHLTEHQNAHVCLVGTAGMGKSTFLQMIAMKIKLDNPEKVIFFFVLQEFLNKLVTTSGEITAQTIKNEMINMTTSCPFGRHVLSHILSNADQRFDLFFDGFDEIPQSQSESAEKLLDTIAREMRNIRIFVATRPHLMEHLESVLGVFGFSFVPLQESDQVELLVKFWKSNEDSGVSNRATLEDYARKCIRAAKGDQDKKENLSNTTEPLQCIFLAEVNQDFTTVDLIKVSTKFEMFQKLLEQRMGRLNTSQNSSEDSTWEQNVKNVHVLAAFDVLFPDFTDHINQILKTNYRHYLNNRTVLGLGIIEPNPTGENSTRFSHRTLAEFILAEFLVDMLLGKNYNIEANEEFCKSLLTFLIDEIFRFNAQDENLIQYTIGGLSSNITIYKFTNQELNYFLNEQLKLRNFNNQSVDDIFGCVEPTPIHIPNIIASCCQKSLNKVCELAIQVFKILHPNADVIIPVETLVAAAKYSNQDFNIYIYGLLDETDILMDHNANLVTPLQMAVHRGNASVFEAVERNLLKFSTIQTMYLFHFSVTGSSLDNAETISKKIEIISTLTSWDTEFNIHTVYEDVDSPLLQPNVHPDLIETLLEEGADVNSTSSSGKTILHTFLQKGHETKIDTKVLNKLLRTLKEHGFNGFNYSSRSQDDDLVYLALCTAHIDKRSLEYFQLFGATLTSLNNDGENYLFLAIRQHQNLECLEGLIEIARLDFSHANRNKETVLHVAAEIGNLIATNFILQLVARSNTGLIHKTDKYGNNALHIAFLRGSLDHKNIQNILLGTVPALLTTANHDLLTPLEYGLRQGSSLVITSERLLYFERHYSFNFRGMATKLLDCVISNTSLNEQLNASFNKSDELDKLLKLLSDCIPGEFIRRLSSINLEYQDKHRSLDTILTPAEIAQLASSITTTDQMTTYRQTWQLITQKESHPVIKPISSPPSIYIPRKLLKIRDDESTDIEISEDTLVVQISSGTEVQICSISSSELGLTSILTSLAKKIKLMFPRRVVARIDLIELVEHHGSFQMKDPSRQILEHITTTQLGFEILKLMFRKGESNLELLFDRLSEIEGRHVSQFTAFLLKAKQDLPNTKFSIFARPEALKNLNNLPNMATFDILPLAHSEHRDFLIEFWKGNCPEVPTKISDLAESNLHRTEKVLVYNRQLIGSQVLLQNYITSKPNFLQAVGTTDDGNDIFRDSFQAYIPYIRTVVSDLLQDMLKDPADAVNNDSQVQYVLHLLTNMLPETKQHSNYTLDQKPNGAKNFLSRVNSHVETKQGLVNTFLNNATREYLAAAVFTKLFFGITTLDMDIPSGKYFEKSMYQTVFGTRFYTTDDHSSKVFDSLRFQNPVRTMQCFEHSKILNMMDINLNGNTFSHIDGKAQERFLEYIEPECLYEIMQGCIFYDFSNILQSLFNILSQLSEHEFLGYKLFLKEDGAWYNLLLASTLHSTVAMTQELCQFFRNMLQINWARELDQDPPMLTPWRTTVQKGNILLLDYLQENTSLILPGRGLLHACVESSSTDSWQTIQQKIEIINKLSEQHRLLVNETWNSLPPILCYDVHVDLLICLILKGATIEVVNDSCGDNIIHSVAKYMSAEQFHQLVCFLLTNYRLSVEDEDILFKALNNNGKTATHDVLERIPNLKLETLKLIFDIPRLNLLSLRRHGNESLFFVDMSNQTTDVETYLLEAGIRYFSENKETDLLDAVTEWGHGNIVNALINSGHSSDFESPVHGNNLLHLSAKFNTQNEFHEHVKLYLERGNKVKIAQQNLDGYTPLHLALQGKEVSVDTIKMILDAGVTIWTSANDVTILETAIDNKRNLEILEILKELEDHQYFTNLESNEVDIKDEDFLGDKYPMEIWQKELVTKLFLLRAVQIRFDSKLWKALEDSNVIDEVELNKLKGTKKTEDHSAILNVAIKTKSRHHFFLMAKALLESGNETASKLLIDGVPTEKISDLKLDITGTHRELKELLKKEETTDAIERLRASLPASAYIDLCDRTIAKNKRIKLVNETIPQPPSCYIPRQLSTRIHVNPKLFKVDSTDVFVFKGINSTQLSRLCTPHATDTSSNQTRKVTVRFILLEHNDDWNEIRSISGNHSVHLIMFHVENNAYTLEETKGYSKYLQQFTSKNQSLAGSKDEPNTLRNEDEILDAMKQTSTTTICICDSAGNGKSTLLASLARKTARLYPNKIVAFISLPQFIKNAPTSKPLQENAKSYLTRKLLLDYISPSPVSQHFLAILLDSGKIDLEVFFDGFDEVLLKQVDFTTEILTTMARSFPNTKLYVSCRPQWRHKLETALRVISYDIIPLRGHERVEYLTKLWKEVDGLCDTTKLRQLAKFLLDNTRILEMKECRSICGSFMQDIIIAKLYTNTAVEFAHSNEDDIPQDFCQFVGSLLELMKNYMDSHFSKVDSKMKSSGDRDIPAADNQIDICQVKHFHVWKAFNVVFPELAELYADHYTVDKNMGIFKYLQFGILLNQSIGSNIAVEFTHVAFTEYLVGEYLASLLMETPSEISQKERRFKEKVYTFLFEQVLDTQFERQDCLIIDAEMWQDFSLSVYNFKYPAIVNFLSMHLENGEFNPLTMQEKFKGKFVFLNTSEKLYKMLNTCCTNNHLVIFRYLKNFLQGIKSSSIKNHKKYLLEKDPDSTWEHHSRALSLIYLAAKHSSLALVQECFQLFKEIFHYNLVDICEVIPETYPTPQHAAILKGDISMVKYFAEKISLANRGLLHTCAENSHHDSLDIIKNKLEICQWLLSQNRELLYKNSREENTVLLVNRIHLDLIKYFINAGANVYSTDVKGNNIVFNAAKYMSPEEYHELIEFLVENDKAKDIFKSGTSSSQHHHFHQILRQAKNLKIETFQLLLSSSGGNVNETDDKGNNLLLSAIQHIKDTTFFVEMIKLGADYTAKNRMGRGVFHLAAEVGNIEAFKFFGQYGLPNTCFDNAGNPPIILAYKNVEMIQFLVEQGVSLHSTDKHGNTVIHLAALGMSTENWNRLITYLINTNKAALVDILGKSNLGGLTPLHARLNSKESMDADSLRLILDLPEIQVNAKDRNGNNLLLVAVSRNVDIAMLKMLMDHGINYKSVNKKGENALHLAVKEANVEAVKIFIDAGVSVNQQDNEKRTPLFIACDMDRRYKAYNMKEKIELIEKIIAALEKACNNNNPLN